MLTSLGCVWDDSVRVSSSESDSLLLSRERYISLVPLFAGGAVSRYEGICLGVEGVEGVELFVVSVVPIKSCKCEVR